MAKPRRAPRFLYFAAFFGAIGVIAAVIGIVSVNRFFRDSFVKGLFWAYAPERLALQSAGCLHPLVVPRPNVELYRQTGVSEDVIRDLCGPDGLCGNESVQCKAITKNLVPCKVVADIHKKYAKPTRPFETRIEILPQFETHCWELYEEDGHMLTDLKKREKESNAPRAK